MLGKKKKKGKKKAEEVVEEIEETGEEGKKGKKGKKKGKKGKKKKLLLLVLIVLIAAGGAGAFLFLRGRGEDGGGKEKEPEPEPEEPIETPAAYTFGETSLFALPVFGGEVLVYSPEPPEPAEGEDPVTAVTYRYEGYTNPREILAGYTGLLTAEDIGFVYVDEELTTTEAPDYEAESGTAVLAKAGAEEDTVMSLQVSWTEEIVSVVTDTVAGRIRQPRPNTMTLLEAEDYVRSLPPSALGLTGESMDSYYVYPLAGSVLVDGKLCLHINVYSQSDSGANEIAGEYFIAADKSHIYRRDAISGKVTAVG